MVIGGLGTDVVDGGERVEGNFSLWYKIIINFQFTIINY